MQGPGRSGKRDWAKLVLGVYFVLFLAFIYAPLLLMGVLSLQGELGSITFPFKGPLSLDWWRTLFDESRPGSNARAIREAAAQSVWLSVAAGAITALLAFSLSMAFRRRFRLDGAAFYLIMLALMTPGYLLALGTQLFWSYAGVETSLWKTALGTNVIWGIPFGFLVMLAVWNRYDETVEEAARDLGADRRRTFQEVTLPLVWTGIFGSFLFGFTLTWNDYDRTLLLISGVETQTLPLQIAGLTFTAAIRPDLYALGSATTLGSILVILVILVLVTLRLRVRGAGKVERVEEELGEVESFDIESLGGTAAR